MKRYYKHIAIGIVLILLFIGLLTNCMLNNIKDTDSILPEDYKYLSLVHGAIAWETGVIRRLYDLGQIFPVYKEDKRGRKIIENYENPEQTHKTVRLIHALFYRVPGSTGQADFGVTTQLAVDDLAAVQLVAEIIAQCEQLRQQRSQFQQAVEYVQGLIKVIAESGWLTKLDTKTTQTGLEKKIKDVQEKPWNENAATALVSMCKLFAKKLETELGADIVNKLEQHRQVTEQFFKLNKETTNNLRKLLKPEVFKKRENVESFVAEALNESDPQNPDALYPSHTVEMILLAFVYKKYSPDRNVLKAFYDALNIQFGGKVLVHELTDEWVKDNFASVTQAEALETIATIFSAKDLIQSITQHFAEFVYDAFQIRSFPAPVGYADAIYEYQKGKKTLKFADCMDNTTRNFINLYAYDAGQNKFMLEKLLASMSIKAVHPALVQFLKDFDSVNMASSPQAHNAWLQVISNIPYVAYNQMVDGFTGQSTFSTGKGYIGIPEKEINNELLSWLKTNDYQVLEKNQYGYELQPSVKNIIIVLDHLLLLNLFSNAGSLAKEFMRSDFIKEYFTKFCIALKATCFLSTQKDAKQSDADKNFDALDYTASEIYTTIDIAKIICTFSTYFGHGELKLTPAEESQNEEQKVVSLVEKISNFNGQSSLSLLAANISCRQSMHFYRPIKNAQYLYVNFFAIPLENTDSLRLIVDKAFSIIPHTTSLKIKTAIKNLLLRLVEKQPDIVQQQRQKIRILKLFIQMINNDDMQNADFAASLKPVIEAAVSTLVEGSIYGSKESKELLTLFKDLFQKNQGFTEVIPAAAKTIGHQNKLVRRMSLDLFKALVSKNQGFKEAMHATAKGITDSDEYVRSLAIEVVEALVEKDQALTEAIEVGVNGVADENLRWSALNLFTLLVSKNKGFVEALSAVKSVITKELDLNVRFVAIGLLDELIVKIPDETKKVIQSLLNDPNIDWGSYEKETLEKILAQHESF